MSTPKLFSAYLLDPEEGWCAMHRLPLETAIRYCKDFRQDWAGVSVAIVPDGADPEPYLKLVTEKRDETFRGGHFLTRGRCDTCGEPCDGDGCTANREHLFALA